MDQPDRHKVLLLGEYYVGIPTVLAALHKHYSGGYLPEAKKKQASTVISIYPPRETPCMLEFISLYEVWSDAVAANLDYGSTETKALVIALMRSADIIIYCYSTQREQSFEALCEWRRLARRDTAGCRFRHAIMLLRIGENAVEREAPLARDIGATLPEHILALHSPPAPDDLDALGLKCCRVSLRLRNERQGISLDPRSACPPNCTIRQAHRHEARTSEFLGPEEMVILETSSPGRATMSRGLDREWMRSTVPPPPPPPLPASPQPKLVANNNPQRPATEGTRLLVHRDQKEPSGKSWFSGWLS